ncbi:aldose epimerase family protein [uncultured Croceitalea sp.]|uniref:aldose epimerase family protein n=1 Tax=uncultured Croceitalea sp. TaxID=1798908 RepID=UPI003305A89A
MKNTLELLDAKNFETIIDGKNVSLVWISNTNGVKAAFTNFGQRLVALYVPDKDGNLTDIVLGFDTIDDYQKPKGAYFGAMIGRYANRIAKGRFTLDGVDYTLTVNNGPNHLHGGVKGFHNRVWDIDSLGANKVTFSRISKDMEEGYPGNLKVTTTYELNNDNELVITYEASTDKPTIVNFTHHSFFNLKGEGEGNVNEHQLFINADHFTPTDGFSVPNGEIRSVKLTGLDFTKAKAIGSAANSKEEQLVFANGHDHNYVLNKGPENKTGLVFAAKVTEPESGRVMQVFTNEPGMQFYAGNYLDGTVIGKSGKKYEKNGSLSLETQHFPNSPNIPKFPSTVLRPDETYHSICVYRFSSTNSD